MSHKQQGNLKKKKKNLFSIFPDLCLNPEACSLPPLAVILISSFACVLLGSVSRP